MSFQVVGCNHRNTPIAIRERLAFDARQVRAAISAFQSTFPEVEVVLLSTCNRVEIYTAGETSSCPSLEQIAEFLGRFHDLPPSEVAAHLYRHSEDAAIRHLFSVAASLDSMVLGEPQILAQVKQAYQLAVEQNTTGPLLHAACQAALKTARRIVGETAIQQRRVSIPSVAVADFAQQIFERFDDKKTLVIGAGEMAEETLRYLQDEGIRDVVVVNRSFERARELADRCQGHARPWDELPVALTAADLVISTTGATEPIVRLDQFLALEPLRFERPLFVLDLAVPRDFDPAIGDRPGVFLYSVDDLQAACQRNQRHREKEMPAAGRIIDQETRGFMADIHRRSSGPIIRRLQEGWQKSKNEELRRLFNKLPELDEHARNEISQSFDRLVNKLLHPPLESLRHESRQGLPGTLLEALARLFQLKD
jgi:glutamyl-tRNA reductase